jgi:Protein of unknown function (DUF2591)
MKIKISEATNRQIDWLAAKCEGVELFPWRMYGGKSVPTDYSADFYSPSTDWAQGGPIIEREVIDLINICPGMWRAISVGRWFNGPTPLIAAMRCYVASKLGDKVEVPELI